MKFSAAERRFKAGNIRELAATDAGLRFLKLRSMSRVAHMRRLMETHSIDAGGKKSSQLLEIIYNSDVRPHDIDKVIAALYEEERSVRRKKESGLINELYKVQSFEWGGLHQNSLEGTIINNYVKKIAAYDELSDAIENKIHNSLRAYVIASWYNHWTSIIIEDIFKDHEKVIPAVGLIKNIDFFVVGKPYDLKVTYFPEGYIKHCRKAKNLRPELTLMKAACRELRIGFESSSPDSVLTPDLWRKLSDHPNRRAAGLIKELQGGREALLDETVNNPEPLIRWLYENQGARRFDAANRLYLVLVDRADFFNSWRLKRARPMILSRAQEYLRGAGGESGFQLDFNWDGGRYTVESDVVFVVK